MVLSPLVFYVDSVDFISFLESEDILDKIKYYVTFIQPLLNKEVFLKSLYEKYGTKSSNTNFFIEYYKDAVNCIDKSLEPLYCLPIYDLSEFIDDIQISDINKGLWDLQDIHVNNSVIDYNYDRSNFVTVYDDYNNLYYYITLEYANELVDEGVAEFTDIGLRLFSHLILMKSITYSDEYGRYVFILSDPYYLEVTNKVRHEKLLNNKDYETSLKIIHKEVKSESYLNLVSYLSDNYLSRIESDKHLYSFLFIKEEYIGVIDVLYLYNYFKQGNGDFISTEPYIFVLDYYDDLINCSLFKTSYDEILSEILSLKEGIECNVKYNKNDVIKLLSDYENKQCCLVDIDMNPIGVIKYKDIRHMYENSDILDLIHMRPLVFEIENYDDYINFKDRSEVMSNMAECKVITYEHILDALSIDELDAYGNETQVAINDTMKSILDDSRVIDLGSAGERLKELADVSKSTKKVLQLKGPLATLSKIVGKYDRIESQIDVLEVNVDDTVNKLNRTLQNLSLNNQALSNYVSNLKEKEEVLREYIELLEERDDLDQTRLQVVVRRLKDITTLRMMAEQNQVTSIVNLQENKEAARQISEIKTNIIPIIRMQLINKIGSKVAAEALLVKQEIYKYTNDLVLTNAEDMSKTADALIESRNTSVYSMENFEKSCDIMISTIERVANSAKLETESNKEIISRMEKTARKMNDLVQSQFLEMANKSDLKLESIGDAEKIQIF